VRKRERGTNDRRDSWRERGSERGRRVMVEVERETGRI